MNNSCPRGYEQLIKEKVYLCSMIHHAQTPVGQAMLTWIKFLYARTS